MNIGNFNETENGLYISVDYLSFTVKNGLTVYEVLERFGLNRMEFQDGLIGCYGYKYRMRHAVYSVSALYEGKEDMGVHVSVTGSAVGYFLECFKERKTCVPVPFGGYAYSVDSFDTTILSDVLEEILSVGQITRLDLAIDDKGCKYYTLHELSDIMKNKCYVSRFKGWKEIVETGEKSGYSIYLGKRTSEIMFRIYDKKLEQNSKNKDSVSDEWVRWEMELHKERAAYVAGLLINGMTIAEVAIGVLQRYIRLINKDNERATRCSTSEKWELFLDGIRSVRICQPVREKSLEEKKDWITKQVAPTFATIYELDGDLSFFYDLIENGSRRLSAELLHIIETEMMKQGYDRM